MANTARMLGKVRRPRTCGYGCCDVVHGFGRILVRRVRRAEKRQLARMILKGEA